MHLNHGRRSDLLGASPTGPDLLAEGSYSLFVGTANHRSLLRLQHINLTGLSAAFCRDLSETVCQAFPDSAAPRSQLMGEEGNRLRRYEKNARIRISLCQRS